MTVNPSGDHTLEQWQISKQLQGDRSHRNVQNGWEMYRAENLIQTRAFRKG